MQSISECTWDIGFFGKAIDERGKEIVNFLKNRCSKSFFVQYNPINFVLTIEGESINDESLFFQTFDKLKILIESTTLGLNEIFKLVNNLNSELVDILYIQPKDYLKEDNSELSPFRNFNLSHSLAGFYPITERMIEINSNEKIKLVIVLGYENYRIDRLFEHFELNPSRCELICGLPAYQAGWELNTFSNNVATLIEKRISNNINYSDASNPFSIFTILEDIYLSLDSTEKMLIFPIGTKPHIIGVLLFLKKYENASVIYDHPIEITGRTKSIGRIFLYKYGYFS
ncbi:hypothetical protein [Leptospira santarosai]|uniref:hypothetical protein n=1 Tax=Leptospira santarosai TaxID=28183 RepID=UPI0024AFF742|nr:hypothetical protein [Leptospira santarosai]MDI7191266.1 hypothetical protein [Leptospira santarosai]MDI7222750.1 hypothetical protein [Leptospira santarosai]